MSGKREAWGGEKGPGKLQQVVVNSQGRCSDRQPRDYVPGEPAICPFYKRQGKKLCLAHGNMFQKFLKHGWFLSKGQKSFYSPASAKPRLSFLDICAAFWILGNRCFLGTWQLSIASLWLPQGFLAGSVYVSWVGFSLSPPFCSSFRSRAASPGSSLSLLANVFKLNLLLH